MSGWVEILRCNNRTEAELAKSLLDSANIKALIKSDDLGGMSPHLTIPSGGVKLLVRSEDFKAAQEILAGPYDIDEEP